MGAFNPFLTLPLDVCDEFDLLAFSECQDGANYPQRLSQVCSLLILPIKAAHPDDWTSLASWQEVIDNSDLTGNKGRYLVGIGSFLPLEEVIVELADGRVSETRDRPYALDFNVLQMTEGHERFGELLQRNWKEFDIWIETVGGRIVGGPYGMRPQFVNSRFPFDGEITARERMEISMNFFFLQRPAVTNLVLDFSNPPTVWGDPDVPDIWGDPDDGTMWGWPGSS